MTKKIAIIGPGMMHLPKITFSTPAEINVEKDVNLVPFKSAPTYPKKSNYKNVPRAKVRHRR